MKRKLIIVGGVALVAAIATTAFFYSMLSDSIVGSDDGPTRAVVVAAKDLPRGTQLEAEDLAVDQRPVDAVDDDSFQRVEDVAGKFIINSLSAGRPVTKKLLPGPGLNGLAAAIPAGMRAVTLHVEEYSGVNDIVRPGDRVDVLAATGNRGRGSQATIETVLTNIEVLATDRERADKDRRVSPTVTVLVLDENVERLGLADQGSNIRLALRNPTDGPHLSAEEPAEDADAPTDLAQQAGGTTEQ